MPDTSIKGIEWAKIGDIMRYILSGANEDIWALYFSEFQDKLLTSHVFAVQKMENQLYGSEDLRLLIESGSLTRELQAQIDQNMKDFI